MNINILWNQISSLTYQHLGMNKSNMFSNHMQISLTYKEDTLPPIKDKSTIIKQSTMGSKPDYSLID